MATNDRGGRDFIVVTQLSVGGARLITPVPMLVGQQVEIKLPLLEARPATIIWVSKRLAGCEFLEPLHPALLRVLIALASTDQATWHRSMAGSAFPPN